MSLTKNNNDYLKEQLIAMAIRDGKTKEHGIATYEFIHAQNMRRFGSDESN